jgi:hypothetical protein
VKLSCLSNLIEKPDDILVHTQSQSVYPALIAVEGRSRITVNQFFKTDDIWKTAIYTGLMELSQKKPDRTAGQQ